MDKKEEMYQHVQECIKNNLNQQAYCVERGINIARFYYWKKKYLQEQINDSSFITVSAPPQSTGRQLELLFPNGLRLYCGYDAPAGLLKELINL